MNSQIIYFSIKGSTKKVADAIASELNIESEDVKNAELKEGAIVFFGSGCYGDKPGKHITKFIENNDFTGRNVALFGTSGGGEGRETEVMETMLKGKEAVVKGK